MTLASVGWACWWFTLFWRHFSPTTAPSLRATSFVAGVFAALGLLFAVGTIRSTRTWLLFVIAALFANASLLYLPWLLEDLARKKG